MIVCLRHPKFNPKSDLPDLTCNTCCNLYILHVRTSKRRIITSSMKEIESKNSKLISQLVKTDLIIKQK